MEKWTVGSNLSQFRQHTAVRIANRDNKAFLAKRLIKSMHLKCVLMNKNSHSEFKPVDRYLSGVS